MNFGLGTDVFSYAREKGIKLLLNDTISNARGAAFAMNGQWYIHVDSHDIIERQCFTIAHELAEIELHEVDDLTLDEKHQAANYRAGEILLPAEVFKPLVFQKTLYELKELFPACSFEVISRRLLKFRPAILTIYDNKKLMLRIGSEGVSYPPRPHKTELDVVEECYARHELIQKRFDNIEMEACYIAVNPDFQRVILLSYIMDEY